MLPQRFPPFFEAQHEKASLLPGMPIRLRFCSSAAWNCSVTLSVAATEACRL